MDSGDETIDSLLNVAKSKILSARFEERKIALEKLWDVFERCKSVYNEDKKKSVEKLLDKVSGGDAAIKKMIEEEMRQLTDIGNKFQIRHSEMKTVPIKSSYYLDYLFFRMYAFVSVLLKKNGDDR